MRRKAHVLHDDHAHGLGHDDSPRLRRGLRLGSGSRLWWSVVDALRAWRRSRDRPWQWWGRGGAGASRRPDDGSKSERTERPRFIAEDAAPPGIDPDAPTKSRARAKQKAERPCLRLADVGQIVNGRPTALAIGATIARLELRCRDRTGRQHTKRGHCQRTNCWKKAHIAALPKSGQMWPSGCWQ